MDVKTKLSLFDTLVVPILLYCSEVWGIYNYRDIDNLHLKFCKIILGVNKQTSNTSVPGELGRYPLSLICKERVLKNWIKIMNNENPPLHRVFIEQLNSNNVKSWAHSVKKLIDNLGFSNIWDNFDKNINYLPLLKQRLKDQYIQYWQSSIQELPKLSYYRQFKTNFGREKYVDIIRNDFLRKTLSRFRMSSHCLEIEVGRYSNIPQNDRMCKLCSNHQVESEYHFLLHCPLYSDLRQKYFGNIPHPNMHTFTNILSSKSVNTLLNTGRFLRDALKLRNSKLS